MDRLDRWAEDVVSALLEEKHLELVSKSSRGNVVAKVAHALMDGTPNASNLAALLMNCAGVAELMCDDDTLAEIVERCEPDGDEMISADDEQESPVVQAPPKDDGLAPELVGLLARATERARRDRHREVTLAHVLAEWLDTEPARALGKRRGGDPEGARAACDVELRKRHGVAASEPTRSWLLADALRRAVEQAARLAGIEELSIVTMAMENGGEDAALFRLAFQPKPPPRPALSVIAQTPDDAPMLPTPADARGPGALVIGRDLAEALRLLHANGERHVESWTELGGSRGWLPAHAVVEAEQELETALPDDFWAAIAARAFAVAALGIGCTMEPGDCAMPERAAEEVLRVSSGPSDLDEGLVAIAELYDDPDGALLCVKRGTAYHDRNAQHVFRVTEEGRKVDLGTFGQYLLRVVQEELEDAKPVVPPLHYTAHLR